MKKGCFCFADPNYILILRNEDVCFSIYFFRYPNELYVEYSIDCNEGDQAFFNLTYFHLQGKECGDGMYNNLFNKIILLYLPLMKV